MTIADEVREGALSTYWSVIRPYITGAMAPFALPTAARRFAEDATIEPYLPYVCYTPFPYAAGISTSAVATLCLAFNGLDDIIEHGDPKALAGTAASLVLGHLVSCAYESLMRNYTLMRSIRFNGGDF